MKRILIFAFVLFLTACSSQPQVTSTLPPTSTPLPTPTETPAPTITPTSIPTLVAFSPETWAKLSPDQKLAVVPVNPEYTAGNVSTLEGKDNYVILRSTDSDKKGEAIGAYNAFTGKVETMSDAGIKIFELTDGAELEMRSFKTVEAYREYLMNDPNLLWMMGDFTARDNATATFFQNPTQESRDLWKKIDLLPGFNYEKSLGDTISGDGSHVGSGEFTPIFIYGVGDASFVASKKIGGNLTLDCIEAKFEELKKIGQ